MVQGTDERTEDRQERMGRALVQQDRAGGTIAARRKRNLEDIPSYASTGTIRIPLVDSGKYWIEIQEELDFGQQTILDNASVIGVQREQMESTAEAGQTVRLDLTRQRFLLCAVWLVAWNIPPDADGRPMRLPRHINDRITMIKGLHAKWGDAIVESITEHVAALQEREEEAQRFEDEKQGIDTIDVDPSDPESDPKVSSNGEYDAVASSSPY